MSGLNGKGDLKLQVLIEQDAEGTYHASCIGLNGCYAHGESYIEVSHDIQEKIQSALETIREKNGSALEIHSPGLIWAGRYT